MVLGLKAITSKKKPLDTSHLQADLIAMNTRFITDIQRKMTKYPPQKPTTYKRTGDYGRGWAGPGAVKISAEEATLINHIRYGVYVGGPNPGPSAGQRQTQVMAEKGWISITDAVAEVKGDYPRLVARVIVGKS